MHDVFQFNVSKELEIGKAGEHLVCADLLLKGHKAFLSDQGLPFDVVVMTFNGLKTIQVKTTQKLYTAPPTKTGQIHSFQAYRFGIRSGRHYNRSKFEYIDYFAFVALDTKQIAYFKKEELQDKNKFVVSMIELRTKTIEYEGRVYSNGTVRGRFGRFIEDYSEFKP